MIKDLILKNRSYRRFHQEVPLSRELLEELVDLARFSASSANQQPLRFILSHDPEKNARIFQHLTWAAYLKDWRGPEDGERPSAYIVLLQDLSVSKQPGCDYGIAAQSMLLGAVEKGFGGCMLGAIKRASLRVDLEIPERYDILLVLALGKPKEKVVLDEVDTSGEIKYWRDSEGVHHVPKRSLNDLILE